MMIKTLRMAAVAALVAAAFALQAPPREIPLCQGSECDGGHAGQPSWCQNSTGGGYKANCECKRDCSDPDQEHHRETGCKTYCRTPRCKCDHGCPKTEAM
jgi:hypothetical protein